jgi:hypothetical protein
VRLEVSDDTVPFPIPFHKEYRPMAHVLRWAVCAALLRLFFVGSCRYFPAERDGPTPPDLPTTYFEELDRGADLGRRLDAAQARQRAQDQIGYELIEGRISLAEAVRRLAALPDPPDQFQELLRLEFAGATDEERLGRLVIRWASGLLRDQPDRAQTLRRRWQAELAHLGTQDPPKP